MENKDVKGDIRDYFFINPTIKLRVREIERKLKLPLPSVIRYCKELKDAKILKKEKFAGIFTYSADCASKEFLIKKKLYHIWQFFSSGLVDYIIKEYYNPVITVFGSYAKGEDIENSDVDLYIETAKKHIFKLGNFEKILNRKIQVFNYH